MTEKKEMELKSRLDFLVTEYCSLEKDKEAYYTKHIKDKSREAIYCLYLRQRMIDHTIRKIAILVEKLLNNYVDVDNEIALILFDEYEKTY